MKYTIKKCPQCGQRYESYEGYVDWCDSCGWNLKPPSQVFNDTSLYERTVKKLGDRYSTQLYDYIKTVTDIKPSLSWQTIVTVFIAVLVFLFWLLLVAAGIWLIAHFPNLFAIIGTVIILPVIWYLRPRFTEYPKKFLARSEAPLLFSIIDELREHLGASPMDYIVLDHQFNASMGYAGWKKKRVLTLGYPLLYVLDAQEIVGLISHELAHDVNKDPTRSYMQWYATSALERWYYITYPVEIISSEVGLLEALVSVPLNLFMWLLSQTFLGTSYLLSWLMWRDSQKAEYYADYLAMTTSGNQSSVSSFQKFASSSILSLAGQRAVLNSKGDGVFKQFDALITELPQREIERIRRVNMLYESRIDASHPPTPYRIGFAQSRGIIPPSYVLKEHRYKQLMQELAAFEKQIEDKLVDEFRARIYR